ncbi:MAG TPA: S8 family serine peptidase, partial [Pyrinomonadaceae bacterium]|nr:S8 family serine peptidase [Pyrinomonadaceae bacterium]
MKNKTRNAVTAWLTTFTLAFSMVAGIMTCDRASASASSRPNHLPQKKASSDLIEKAHGAHSADRVKVIVQLNAPMSGQLNALLNQNGVHGARKTFDKLNAQMIEMPANIVEAVAGFSEVAFVSPDRPTQSTGHLSATTGADLVRAPKSVTTTTTTALGATLTNVTTVPGLDGSGIGVAIMDSGIYKQHTDFLDKVGIGRVIYSKDFTGENRTDDPYGHGSHVAAIAGGNGRVSNSAYLG